MIAGAMRGQPPEFFGFYRNPSILMRLGAGTGLAYGQNHLRFHRIY